MVVVDCLYDRFLIIFFFIIVVVVVVVVEVIEVAFAVATTAKSFANDSN